jgi:hypothetical protein
VTALDLKVQDKWSDGIRGDFIPEYKKSGYAAFFVAFNSVLISTIPGSRFQ